MAFKQYCSTASLACMMIPGLLASCAVAGGDDTAALDDSVLVHPDSVIRANQCGVGYTISQSTTILSVSGSGLRAQTSATAVIDGTIAGITSVTFVESAEVDPTALADNQTPASARTLKVQPGLSTDPAVSATATWLNATQFNNADLCTAKVTSSMFVNYSDGTNCPIRLSTTYPTCETNH